VGLDIGGNVARVDCEKRKYCGYCKAKSLLK